MTCGKTKCTDKTHTCNTCEEFEKDGMPAACLLCIKVEVCGYERKEGGEA